MRKHILIIGYISTVFLFFYIGNFVFSENVTVIPEVQVRKQHKGSTTQTTGFNRKEIKSNPAITLSGLFQQQSIVRVANNSGDNSQTEISIRGFGDNAIAKSKHLL